MIVRRITAGAAGLALAGTALAAAAPAMAKSNTTSLALDAGLVQILTDGGVKVSAKSPAKMSGTTISLPAKRKGNTITHKGGISFKGAATVTLVNLVINAKNGNLSASTAAGEPLPVAVELANVMKLSGGKNKLKKGGTTWKGAKLKLAKSVSVAGSNQDPAEVIGTLLGIPGKIPSGATVGKVNIQVK